MDGLSRRKMLIAGGGALGMLGAAAITPSAWAWAPSGSVAGSGTGADPRWVWDPEADQLVASIIERGDVPRVNALLPTWTRNDQPLPDGLPADLRDFMDKARQLPAWADQAKLTAATNWLAERWLYFGLIHLMGSGTMSFTIPNEVRAVYYSKGGADVKDRTVKTATFGTTLQAHNAFQPDGQFLVTTVKTRLIHAAVRHLLPQSPYWSATSNGHPPISQHEILVTFHSLATFAKRKLAEWKIRISSTQSDNYLHAWQVGVHMLGLRDEYIPNSWDNAFAQSKQILDPILGPTTEGVKYMEVAMDMLAEAAAGPGAPLAKPMIGELARYVAGNQICDWVNVPHDPFWATVIRTGLPQWVAVNEGLLPLPLLSVAFKPVGEAISNLALRYLNNGQEVSLTIPDANRPENG